MARTKKDYNDFTVNHLEPAVSLRFEQALSEIGPKTPLGNTLRRVWGCKISHFRLGKERLKYPVGIAFNRTLARDKATGLFYHKDTEEELGLARHIIEVWLPPSYFGSDGTDTTFDISVNTDKRNLDRWEANWNEYRFEFQGAETVTRASLEREFAELQDVNAVLGKVGATLLDLLGPFPRNGDYRHFYTIEDPESGEYKEPAMDDIDFIRASYKAAYETPFNPEQEVRDIIYRRDQRDQQLYASMFDRQQLQNEAKVFERKSIDLHIEPKKEKEDGIQIFTR